MAGWLKRANSKVEGMFENNPYMENVGQAAEGAIGLYGMFDNIAQTAKEAGNVQYDLGGGLLDTNPYERPTYDLGNAFAESAAFDPSQVGKGLIGESVMAGIGAGASAGSVGRANWYRHRSSRRSYHGSNWRSFW
jgi:hypothetical protein